jgi:hypothetical protein
VILVKVDLGDEKRIDFIHQQIIFEIKPISRYSVNFCWTNTWGKTSAKINPIHEIIDI